MKSIKTIIALTLLLVTNFSNEAFAKAKRSNIKSRFIVNDPCAPLGTCIPQLPPPELTEAQTNAAINVLSLTLFGRPASQTDLNANHDNVKLFGRAGLENAARAMVRNQAYQIYFSQFRHSFRMIESLYAGFMNRCSDVPGYIGFNTNFKNMKADRGGQNLINWAQSTLNVFFNSQEWRTGVPYERIINSSGSKIKICAGLALDIYDNGGRLTELLLRETASNTTVSMSTINQGFIFIMSVGGNGSAQAKFFDVTGGPYNAALNHVYVLDKDSALNQSQFYSVYAKSGSDRTVDLTLRFRQ